MNTQLDEAKRRGDDFLKELIQLRGQKKSLEARNLELEPLVELAREIVPVVEPPEWIDEYGVFSFGVLNARDAADRVTFRQWAGRAAQIWPSIDALSGDSKRHLEEACWATLRDANGAGAGAYSVTPLLAETVKLLQSTPEIVKANPFELRAEDFQRFAQWLDIVELLGRERYWRLRDLAGKLVRDRAGQLLQRSRPADESEDEPL